MPLTEAGNTSVGARVHSSMLVPSMLSSNTAFQEATLPILWKSVQIHTSLEETLVKHPTKFRASQKRFLDHSERTADDTRMGVAPFDAACNSTPEYALHMFFAHQLMELGSQRLRADRLKSGFSTIASERLTLRLREWHHSTRRAIRHQNTPSTCFSLTS